MDPTYLEELVRWHGVAVALAGSLLAAPDATRRGAARAVGWTGGYLRRARMALKHFWRWVTRQKLTPNSGSALGDTLVTSDVLSAEWHRAGWAPDEAADLPARLARVEAELQELGKRMINQQQALTAEEADRQAADAVLRQEALSEVAGVRASVVAMKRDALTVDATALPLIGLGVVLSGVPETLARSTSVGIVAVLIAQVVLAWGLVRFPTSAFPPRPGA